MNFGIRLSQLRNEHGWTQDELAKRLRVSRSAVSMYEKGGRRPNYDALNELSEIFDVSVAYLTGASDIRGHAKPQISEEDERDGFLASVLSPEEFAVLCSYKSASSEIKAAVRAVLNIK